MQQVGVEKVDPLIIFIPKPKLFGWGLIESPKTWRRIKLDHSKCLKLWKSFFTLPMASSMISYTPSCEATQINWKKGEPAACITEPMLGTSAVPVVGFGDSFAESRWDALALWHFPPACTLIKWESYANDRSKWKPIIDYGVFFFQKSMQKLPQFTCFTGRFEIKSVPPHLGRFWCQPQQSRLQTLDNPKIPKSFGSTPFPKKNLLEMSTLWGPKHLACQKWYECLQVQLLQLLHVELIKAAKASPFNQDWTLGIMFFSIWSPVFTTWGLAGAFCRDKGSP